MSTPFCPICQSTSFLFTEDRFRKFFRCEFCESIFVPSEYWPDAKAEKARYDEHQNDVNDAGYQLFVRPIIEAITSHFTKHHRGLDYGAGPGPVVTKLLRDLDYSIDLYDPFYYNDKELLNFQYDYLVASEVVEHFHHPLENFKKMKKLLLPGGKIFIFTHLYEDSIPFQNWYYKNDLTHVIFFTNKSMHYLAERLGFSKITIDKRLIILSHS